MESRTRRGGLHVEALPAVMFSPTATSNGVSVEYVHDVHDHIMNYSQYVSISRPLIDRFESTWHSHSIGQYNDRNNNGVTNVKHK